MTDLLADAPTTLRRMLPAPDDATVVVTATTVAGTVVLDEAAATFDAATDLWSVAWPATSGPDLVDVVWDWNAGTGVLTDRVAIVGALYCTPDEVRAYTSAPSSASDHTIKLAIDQVVAAVERYCGVSGVPRLSVVTADADSRWLQVPVPVESTSVTSSTVDGTVSAVGLLEVDGFGTVTVPSSGRWVLNVVHGYLQPPADVKQAVMDVVARIVTDTAGSGVRNARVQVSEGASYLVAQADPTRGRLFGIPTADAVFNEWRHGRVVVA